MTWGWGDNKDEDIKQMGRDMDRWSKLEAENARLRAELNQSLADRDLLEHLLDKLTPEPKVEVRYAYVAGIVPRLGIGPRQTSRDNLQLTFHDGNLVSAKIKNDKGDWV